jgi:UDPglucose 6-dehydrogenase
MDMKIGCIGQGFVGKNTADNFVERGFEVIRYAIEPEYQDNKEKIAECDIVFIAVPTPSTPEGFDYSIVHDVIALVGEGKTAVIKSTLLPGTTTELQSIYPRKTVLFSPEFLCEATAAYDVANPILNIVGYSESVEGQKEKAEKVMSILPDCEHNFVTKIESAELFKYAHNLNGYFRVILSNLLYDVGSEVGARWDEVSDIMDKDVMMSPYYNHPVHKGGRGAGGNCFIKDMAAFRFLFESLKSEDKLGIGVLKALEEKNVELLKKSGKDEKLIKGVYGY